MSSVPFPYWRAPARLVVRLQARSWGARMIRTAAATPGLGEALRASVGPMQPHATRAEAEAAARRFSGAGHDSPTNVALHLRLAESPRPSDYPAMLHLKSLLGGGALTDLGGNAGNLFYLYARYLDLPADFVWTVQELPGVCAQGRAIAAARGETRLRFETDSALGPSTETLLVSGALHYWAEPLGALLDGAEARPRHVLVNRTPLSQGRTFHVVQDAGDFLVAATIHDAAQLRADMAARGYQLVDSWRCEDLSLHTPLADDWPCAYQGFYWRLV